MRQLRCPVCEGRRVAFSRRLLRDAWRAIRGSRKRRCLDCAHKWHEKVIRSSSRARGAALAGLLVAVAVGAAWIQVLTADLSAETTLAGQWRSRYTRAVSRRENGRSAAGTPSP